MKGYYKDEKLTEEVFTPDGWFRTGDLGELADNGYLYINGRIKNMILGPSGENIYPESIESIIKHLRLCRRLGCYRGQGSSSRACAFQLR
jgi:long-chain acyl-CoA synthetase